MNLVLGAIYGYDWENVKHFVISLRKHYDGKIAFIVDMNVITNAELMGHLNDYGVFFHLYDKRLQSNHEIQNNRFELYSDIIKEHYSDIDRIFITDVRDVIFQDDPFVYDMVSQLEFYAEPATFKECNCNSWWIKTMCGEEIYQEMKDRDIICCGTIMGKREALLEYLEVFKQEFQRMRDAGRVFIGGEDTVAHNRLIYTNRVPGVSTIKSNGEGAVSTMEHQKSFNFDDKGRYLNKDGRPTPVIHQWDRKKDYIDLFNKIALE